MSTPTLTDLFASHAFLRGLCERHRLLLASGARPFRAAPGDFLAREGETAKAFYLIQAGHVSISVHGSARGPVPIQTVGPGEVVGWSWLVPPHRWQFDCQARDPVEGIVIDGAWLRDQCEQDHELGFQLLRQLVSVIGGRLAATRVQMLDLYK